MGVARSGDGGLLCGSPAMPPGRAPSRRPRGRGSRWTSGRTGVALAKRLGLPGFYRAWAGLVTLVVPQRLEHRVHARQTPARLRRDSDGDAVAIPPREAPRRRRSEAGCAGPGPNPAGTTAPKDRRQGQGGRHQPAALARAPPADSAEDDGRSLVAAGSALASAADSEAAAEARSGTQRRAWPGTPSVPAPGLSGGGGVAPGLGTRTAGERKGRGRHRGRHGP